MDYNHAFIFGIGGQDGSYLAEFLLAKGYNVHGFVRRSSVDNLWRIKGIRDKVTLHRGDLTDAMSMHLALERFYCTNDADRFEVYNLADQDEVGWSNDVPGYSWDVTFGAVPRMLESLRMIHPTTHFFQPLSATMFGFRDGPINFDTPTAPQSPYAVAKLAAWNACRYYRDVHKMHVVCGILFNHESVRRGPGYLLQSLARQAVAVAKGQQDKVKVRSQPYRIVDIGWAKDFAARMHDSLSVKSPTDWIIGTGLATTVQRWAKLCLRAAGADEEAVEYGDEHGDLYGQPELNLHNRWTLPEEMCKALVGKWFLEGSNN